MHLLGGLDAEAASALAERVLSRTDEVKQHKRPRPPGEGWGEGKQGALRYRNDPALADLLKLLAGYPLAIQEAVLDQLNDYPAEALQGGLVLGLVGVVDDIAKRQFLLKRYTAAEASYRKALEILENNRETYTIVKGSGAAGIWHQLGNVAEEQRQWAQAEDYYPKALGDLY